MSSGTTGIRSIPMQYWFAAVIVLALGVVPLMTSLTQLVAMTGILYLMMFAMTWDVASGYMGELNLGHAFFIAVGGYTTAILNISHGVSPLLSIPAAIVISAIAGLLIGVPSLRLRGPYLALITLVMPTIFYRLIIVFKGTFKGSSGFNSPPTSFAGVGGTTAGSIIEVSSQPVAVIIDYYIAYAVLIILFVLLVAYTRSDAGRILTAIRADEDAVITSGINPAKHKVFVFMISAATAGFAGAMYVHSAHAFPHPAVLLPPTLSLNVIIISVIGGIGTIIGAIVGALIFGGIEFIAGQLGFQILGQSLSDVILIFLFIFAGAVVYYRPEGLVPYFIEKGREWRRTDNDAEPAYPATDGGRTPVEQAVEKFKRKVDEITPSNNE